MYGRRCEKATVLQNKTRASLRDNAASISINGNRGHVLGFGGGGVGDGEELSEEIH